MKKLKIQVQKIDPKALAEVSCDVLLTAVPSLKKLPKNWPGNLRSAVTRGFKAGMVQDSDGALLQLPAPTGFKARRLIVLRQDLKAPHHELAKPLHRALALAASSRAAAWWAPEPGALDVLVRSAQTQTYRYTHGKKNPVARLEQIKLIGPERPSRREAEFGRAVGCGQNLMRELSELPGNVCTPEYLARRARTLGGQYRQLTAKVHTPTQLKRLKMNTLLQVGLGSGHPPRLIELHYKGAGRGRPIVLVGKGITFDTGGISLKPGAKMDEMKFDMSGAAAVFGAMLACAEAEIRSPVIGLIAAAENMPDGLAGRPGDVVTTMSGKTVEILNTDAEGRLVLCDALTFAQRFKPRAVIDLATLTGACVVALGHVATGLMSNDEALAQVLLEAGQRSGDRAWQLPLWPEYRQQLHSEYADLANIGGAPAGTITAGCFLQEFAEEFPWAHLDIAGTAWPDAMGRKRSSGCAVPLLMEYLRS